MLNEATLNNTFLLKHGTTDEQVILSQQMTETYTIYFFIYRADFERNDLKSPYDPYILDIFPLGSFFGTRILRLLVKVKRNDATYDTRITKINGDILNISNSF